MGQDNMIWSKYIIVVFLVLEFWKIWVQLFLSAM